MLCKEDETSLIAKIREAQSEDKIENVKKNPEQMKSQDYQM